ncbi:MAG: hypothetical protein V2A73_07585 [Pseudomonadota bacterium]
MGNNQLGTLSPKLSAEIDRLREKIEQWQQTRRTSQSRMPVELRESVIGLARIYGAYRTAGALGLRYSSLLRWLAKASTDINGAKASGGESCGGNCSGGGGFVEVDGGAQLLGIPQPTGAVVELASGDGMRLTIRLAPEARLDVARLVHGFCRHGGR